VCSVDDDCDAKLKPKKTFIDHLHFHLNSHFS